MTIEQAYKYVANHPKLDSANENDKEAVSTLLLFTDSVMHFHEYTEETYYAEN